MPDKPRIGIACLMQESNSFSERKSIYSDFGVERHAELCARYSGTNTELGGFLQGSAECGFEPVPLISAWAVAGGPLELASFDRLVTELCELATAAKADGLLLALHGALLLEDDASGDLEIARRVRAALPVTPFIITMDYHANVSRELMDYVDGISGYRTYPHIDMAETGVRACRLMRRRLSGKRARNHWVQIPVIFPAESSGTSEEPMRGIMQPFFNRFPEANGQFASLFCVQPWLDVPAMGSSLVVTDFSDNPDIAAGMQEVAKEWWARRRECSVEWTAPSDLMNAIASLPHRPVLISEAYDAPNGGSTGDHTGLLECLLADPARFRTCLFLVDPVLPPQVKSGGRLQVTVGSRLNPAYSQPLTFEAEVVSVSNGDFVLKGPVFTGKTLSMGPTCVLRVGTTQVVVGSRPVLTSDPELFRSQGIEPREQDAVGIKSPNLFRAAYESISKTVLYLDHTGPCRGYLQKVPFRNIGRPIFPLDDFDWEPDRA